MFAGDLFEADRLPSEFKLDDQVSLIQLEEDAHHGLHCFVRIRVCHLRDLTVSGGDWPHIFTRFEGIVVSTDGELFEDGEPFVGYIRDDRTTRLVNGNNEFESEPCKEAADRFGGM
jgi:hypothetical protein